MGGGWPSEFGRLADPDASPEAVRIELGSLPASVLTGAIEKQLLKRIDQLAAELAELRLHTTALERRPRAIEHHSPLPPHKGVDFTAP